MNNLNGILLMIAAMAGFALEDLFVKLLSSTVPLGQILMTLGIGSSTIFVLLAKTKGHSVFTSSIWIPTTIARAIAEAIAAVAFITSLSQNPISTVAAVFQVVPLVITMGAALFLGEQVGWRRWVAIAIGFCGVLLIIKPGFSGFDPSMLWILLAVMAVAVRDLVTRNVPKYIASTVISFQAFASLVLVGFIMLFLNSDAAVSVSNTEMAYFAGGIVFGVAGYYGIVSSMRVGDAAIVTPFRYTRLVFSIIIGVLVFNERPDTLTLLGATIIIATGLYTLVRERKALSH